MCRINKEFDDYYFTVYSLNDDFIVGFDDIETLTKFFNIELKEVFKNIRNKRNFILNGKLVKLYVYKKEKNIESRGIIKW